MVSSSKFNSVCPLPWIHLEATQLGEVRPCCMWEGKPLGKVEDFGKVDFQNHPTLKKVRCQMIKGERPEGCKKCFLMEDTGDGSPRTWEKQMHPNLEYNTLEDGTIKPELKYTNFRFSAVCNLACRMCGPWASTRWNKEFDEIHKDEGLNHTLYPVNSEYQSQQIYRELEKHLDNLVEIHFAGGEPLITREHYLILDKLIESKRSNVKICYNTNATVLSFGEYSVLDMWKKFVEAGNRVQVDLSLDAVGDAAEYIRYGCKWSKVVDTIKEIVEFRNQYSDQVNVSVCPTVSVLNVYRFPDLFEFCINLGIFSADYDQISINNYVTSPPWYDLRILPTSQKLKVKEDLENQLGRYKRLDTYIESTINFMQGTVSDASWHIKEFYKYTKRLDILRNQNFLDINPEFTDWFNFLEKRYCHLI